MINNTGSSFLPPNPNAFKPPPNPNMMVAPNPNAFVAPAPNPNMFVNPAPNPNAFVAPAPNPGIFVAPSPAQLNTKPSFTPPSAPTTQPNAPILARETSYNMMSVDDSNRDKHGFMDDELSLHDAFTLRPIKFKTQLSENVY